MSYTNLVYHAVCRTYRSIPAIAEVYEKELYAYILGLCNNNQVRLYRIGGMPDHIHMLLGIPPTIAVSDFMKKLKYATSVWLKNNEHFPLFEGWGEGYAAFTYSKDDVPTVRNYIIGQKEHHKLVTFAEEYRQFLIDNGVEIDERYFLKD